MNFFGSRLGFWFANREFDFSIKWVTQQTNITQPNTKGWSINNNGLLVRFNIEDSTNCGGTNSNIQSGEATATIFTGSKSYSFVPTLTGIGEAQATGYEKMSLYLGVKGTTPQEIVRADSAGGGFGCTKFSPVKQVTVKQPPYILAPNTSYTFKLVFTTGDPLYHVNCYYQCALAFNPL